jgi:hypothetical protein
MAKRKYDLAELKKEYLTWDFESVSAFIMQKWLKNKINGKDFKWWDKDKKKLKEKALEKAIKKTVTKQANALEIPIEQLSLAKKNAVVKVIQQMMNKDLNMHDLDRTIRILRTEMWLPVTYTKSENLNIEKVEWIHIIMWAKPVQSD